MHAPTSSYIDPSGSSLSAIADHVVQGYRRHTNYSPLTRPSLMDAGYSVDRTSDKPRNSPSLHRPPEAKTLPEEATASGRTGPNASFRDDTFRQLHPTSTSTLPRPILPLSNQVHSQHVYQQFQSNRSHIPRTANDFERQEYVLNRNDTHIYYSNEGRHQTNRQIPIDNRYQHSNSDIASHRSDYGTPRSESCRPSQNDQHLQFWHDKHQSEDHNHSQQQRQLPHGTNIASLRWLQVQNSLMNNQDPIFRQANRRDTHVLHSPTGQYSKNTEPDYNFPGYKPNESFAQHAQPTHTHCPVTDGFQTPAKNPTAHPANQLHVDASGSQGRSINIDDQELNNFARTSGHQVQERSLGPRIIEESQRSKKESWNGAVRMGTENHSEHQEGSHASSSGFSIVNLMCQDDVPQASMQSARYSDPSLSGTKGHSRALLHNSHTDALSTSTEGGRLPEVMDDVISINGAEHKIERPGSAASPPPSRNEQLPLPTRLDSSVMGSSSGNLTKQSGSTRQPENNAAAGWRSHDDKLQLDTFLPLKPFVPPDPVIDFAQVDLASLKLYQQQFGIPAPLRRCHTEGPVPHSDLAELVASHFKKKDSWPWISRTSRPVSDTQSSMKLFGSISRPQLMESEKRRVVDSRKSTELDEEEMKIEQDRVRDSFINAVHNQRNARAYPHLGSRNVGSLGDERELPLAISEATDSDETSDDMDIDIENDSDVGTTLNERYFSNVLRKKSSSSAKRAQKADSKPKGVVKTGGRKNSNGNISRRKKSAQSNGVENSKLKDSSISTPIPAPPTAAILRRQSAKSRNRKGKGKGKASVQPFNDAKDLGSNHMVHGISNTATSSSMSTTPTNPGITKSFQSSLTAGANVNQSNNRLVEDGARNGTPPVDGTNRPNSAYGLSNKFSTPITAQHPQHSSQIPRQLPGLTPNGESNIGTHGGEDGPDSLPPRVIYVGGVGNGILPGRSAKEWGMS